TEGGGLPIRRQPGPGKGVPVVGERVLEENAAAVSGIPADDPLALVLSAAGRVLAPVKVQGWSVIPKSADLHSAPSIDLADVVDGQQLVKQFRRGDLHGESGLGGRGGEQ